MLRTICSIYRFASIQAIYRGMDFCPYRPALVLYGAVAWSHVLWWNSWRWRNSLEDRKGVYILWLCVKQLQLTPLPLPLLQNRRPNVWALVFRTRRNTLYWAAQMISLELLLSPSWKRLLSSGALFGPLFEWNSADLQQISPWRSDSRPDWRMAHP